MQVYVPKGGGLDPGFAPPGSTRIAVFDSNGDVDFVSLDSLTAWSDPTLISTSGTGWSLNGYWRNMGDLYEFSFNFFGSVTNSSFSQEVFNFSTVDGGVSPCQDFSLRMPTASEVYGGTPDIRVIVFEDGSVVVLGDVREKNYQVHGFFTNGHIVS